MPACWSSVEDWKEWNRLTLVADRPEDNYCADCTPESKQRMMHEGRCSHPEVVFIGTRRDIDLPEEEDARIVWTGVRP